MYEVYHKDRDGTHKVFRYSSKKDAEECAQRLAEAWKLVDRPDVTFKIKYVKPDYIYVIKRDGKYRTTIKTRQLARDYVSMVKGFGANINKKYTITQINLNNVEGKIVR